MVQETIPLCISAFEPMKLLQYIIGIISFMQESSNGSTHLPMTNIMGK